MEKREVLKVDLTGETSCRKTHTASGLSESLSKKGYNTYWLSRGDYYRLAGEILHDWNYSPEQIDDEVIGSLSARMGVKFIDRRLVPFDRENGNHTKQTFQNGALAANYSQNPSLQAFIEKLETTGIAQFAPNLSILINEGRLPDGEVHIRHSATLKSRLEIRRKENSLPANTTDETLIEEFKTRDHKDASLLSQVPTNSVINVGLENWTEETDEHIVQYLTRMLIDYKKGNLPPDFTPIGATFGLPTNFTPEFIRR